MRFVRAAQRCRFLDPVRLRVMPYRLRVGGGRRFLGIRRRLGYAGYDHFRQRFMVGDGTPCPALGDFQYRLGWRKAFFTSSKPRWPRTLRRAPH